MVLQRVPVDRAVFARRSRVQDGDPVLVPARGRGQHLASQLRETRRDLAGTLQVRLLRHAGTCSGTTTWTFARHVALRHQSESEASEFQCDYQFAQKAKFLDVQVNTCFL